METSLCAWVVFKGMCVSAGGRDLGFGFRGKGTIPSDVLVGCE